MYRVRTPLRIQQRLDPDDHDRIGKLVRLRTPSAFHHLVLRVERLTVTARLTTAIFIRPGRDADHDLVEILLSRDITRELGPLPVGAMSRHMLLHRSADRVSGVNHER